MNPLTLWVGVLKLGVNLSRVDGVLHAKFQLWGTNYVAASSGHACTLTSIQSPLSNSFKPIST